MLDENNSMSAHHGRILGTNDTTAIVGTVVEQTSPDSEVSRLKPFVTLLFLYLMFPQTSPLA